MKTPPRATLRWLATGVLSASLMTGCGYDITPTVQADVPSTAAPVYDFIRIWPVKPSDAPQATVIPKVEQRATPRPTSHPGASKSHSVSGVATWYCWPAYPSRCTRGYPSTGAYGAAGPELRAALGKWRGRTVWVNGVAVTLVDFCACGGNHVIDVYHATWLTIPHPNRVDVRW